MQIYAYYVNNRSLAIRRNPTVPHPRAKTAGHHRPADADLTVPLRYAKPIRA